MTAEAGRARWVWIGVGAAAVIGLALRLWVVGSYLGHMDADEAVWGLMAKHVLHGEFPALFWGQSYGGTLEIYLTAPLVFVLGMHKWSIEVVPLLLDGLSAVLVWRVGLRLFGEPAARIAAALFWIWPAYSIWKSTKAHGFYGTVMVASLLAILLVLRLREEVSTRDVALLGTVLGVGLWSTPQIVVVAAPILLYITVWNPACLKKAHWFVAGAMVGAAPWIAYSVRHNWETLRPISSSQGTFLDHVSGSFRDGIPAILGLRVPWTQEWLVAPWLGRLAYAAVLTALTWFVLETLFGRGTERKRLAPLALIALAYPFVFSLSSQGWYVAEPRYFYLLTPVLVLLGVAAMRRWSAWKFAVVGGGLLSLTVAGLALMSDRHVTSQGLPDVKLPADISPLLHVLEEHHVHHVYAHYWLAYRIDFETDERIIASSDEGGLRNFDYAAAVDNDPDAAHVFVAGQASEEPYLDSLAERDVPFQRLETGRFVIYIPLEPRPS